MEDLKYLIEHPAAAVCFALAILALVVYKALPMLSKRAKTYSDDDAFMRRFESHAKRVHDFSGRIAELGYMRDRIKELENKVAEQALIVSRVERIELMCNTTGKSVDDISERLETLRVETKNDVNGLYERLNSGFNSLYGVLTEALKGRKE